MDSHVHGATTTQRLRDAGLGPDAIAGKVRRGELISVQRRLYRHQAASTGAVQIAALGILAMKGKAVVTGGIALRWRNLSARKGPVDLVVPEGLAIVPVRGVRYRRSSHLAGMSVDLQHDLATAPLEWAIGDYARDASDAELARLIAQAVGARLTSLQAIEEYFSIRHRFSGRARLRRVIAQLKNDLPFSATEAKGVRLLREAGLPVRMQYPIVHEGKTVRLADGALPHLRLDLELDGPHHWLPDQAAIDRRIDRTLRGIDWQVERFPVYDIDDNPARFVKDVLAVVARMEQVARAA